MIVNSCRLSHTHFTIFTLSTTSWNGNFIDSKDLFCFSMCILPMQVCKWLFHVLFSQMLVWLTLYIGCHWQSSHVLYLSCCHIHKIMLSTTLDLRSHIHQLWSTLTQVAVRTLQTSLYILLHSVPCTFDPSVLDSLFGFHYSCVRLWTQLWLTSPLSLPLSILSIIQTPSPYINSMYSELRSQFEYRLR